MQNEYTCLYTCLYTYPCTLVSITFYRTPVAHIPGCAFRLSSDQPYIGSISALYRLYIGSILALYRLYIGSTSALHRLYIGSSSDCQGKRSLHFVSAHGSFVKSGLIIKISDSISTSLTPFLIRPYPPSPQLLLQELANSQ